MLAGYPYLISATASGFHDFGHMGEHLLLRPGDGEVVEAEVGLVPIRIAVVVTLRELRPLHHPDSMQRDVTGQVRGGLACGGGVGWGGDGRGGAGRGGAGRGGVGRGGAG